MEYWHQSVATKTNRQSVCHMHVRTAVPSVRSCSLSPSLNCYAHFENHFLVQSDEKPDTRNRFKNELHQPKGCGHNQSRELKVGNSSKKNKKEKKLDKTLEQGAAVASRQTSSSLLGHEGGRCLPQPLMFLLYKSNRKNSQ